jgi:hypothetical protein
MRALLHLGGSGVAREIPDARSVGLMTSFRLFHLRVAGFVALAATAACQGSSSGDEGSSVLTSDDTAAPAHVVQGTSTYTKDYCIECGDVRPTFSDLEQLGVQRAAETDALWNCTTAGYVDCVPLAVRMNGCNSFGPGPGTNIACTAQSTAADRTTTGVSFGAPVLGTATYTKDYCIECGDARPSFSDLEQLGVQRAAEADAVAKCSKAGFAGCAVVAVRLSGCNSFGTGPSTNIACTAQASATGTH